jgi:hypothetical protein
MDTKSERPNSFLSSSRLNEKTRIDRSIHLLQMDIIDFVASEELSA